MKYGLTEEQLLEIVNVLSRFPEIERAVLFGSRARGTYKEGSDVDLAIEGRAVTSKTASAVKFELEDETYLPFFFDIISLVSIENEALLENVTQTGCEIYCSSEAIK